MVTLEERLFNRTAIMDNGCWMFLGAWNSDGYGCINVKGKICSAHRVSYELLVGAIPEGTSVLHSCDNRYCINPDHLFLGTQLDNVHDMMAKGRANFNTMKLTETQIEEIRELLNKSQLSLVEIGMLFEVSSSTIFWIKHSLGAYKEVK